MLAGYNRWANERLYEAAEKPTDADYRKPLGAFFGSLHGTLNHLLVTDRIWMRRLTGEGPEHKRLDEIAYDDFAALAAARRDEDERIIGYVESLDGRRSRRALHLPHDHKPGRGHAAARVRTGASVQPPDAPSRAGARAADHHRRARRSAVAGPAPVSSARPASASSAIIAPSPS